MLSDIRSHMLLAYLSTITKTPLQHSATTMEALDLEEPRLVELSSAIPRRAWAAQLARTPLCRTYPRRSKAALLAAERLARWRSVGSFQWAGRSNDTVACDICPPGTFGLVLHKLHKGHLLRHERSLAHRIALVGPGSGQCELRRQQAPTAEQFRDAWHVI